MHEDGPALGFTKSEVPPFKVAMLVTQADLARTSVSKSLSFDARLIDDIAVLKRVHVASHAGSLADRLFARCGRGRSGPMRAWCSLLGLPTTYTTRVCRTSASRVRKLLGDHLVPLIARLREAELATLPEPLAARVRAALAVTATADTPEGRAFNAADVIDRVLQVRYHEAAAAFRAEQALGEMELVHPGPAAGFPARRAGGGRAVVTAEIRSPRTGRALHADTPHSLAAPDERWPVVDAIPFLRSGREALAAAALAALDAGDAQEATALLFTRPRTTGPPGHRRRYPIAAASRSASGLRRYAE